MAFATLLMLHFSAGQKLKTLLRTGMRFLFHVIPFSEQATEPQWSSTLAPVTVGRILFLKTEGSEI